MALLNLLLLLLLLGLGVSVNSAVSLQKRIIGGYNCNNNERHFHVRLEDGGFRCGGSLISSEWILTATHCWEEAKSLKVTLGVHPRNNKKPDIQFIQKNIHNAVVYMDANNNPHDIMLVKLQKPTNIQHVQLPDCNENKKPKIGDTVKLAGEGPTQTGPNNQQLSNSPIPENLQCVDMMVDGYIDFEGYNFLVKALDKCPGPADSGSGVLFNNMIYGVISQAGHSVPACKEPSGMLDVCRYLTWIKQKTGL